MIVKVVKPVTVRHNGKFCAQNDSFELAAPDAERLGDLVEAQESEKTVAELRKEAEKKGIEIPKGIKKAKLIGLLNDSE